MSPCLRVQNSVSLARSQPSFSHTKQEEYITWLRLRTHYVFRNELCVILDIKHKLHRSLQETSTAVEMNFFVVVAQNPSIYAAHIVQFVLRIQAREKYVGMLMSDKCFLRGVNSKSLIPFLILISRFRFKAGISIGFKSLSVLVINKMLI